MKSGQTARVDSTLLSSVESRLEALSSGMAALEKLEEKKKTQQYPRVHSRLVFFTYRPLDDERVCKWQKAVKNAAKQLAAGRARGKSLSACAARRHSHNSFSGVTLLYKSATVSHERIHRCGSCWRCQLASVGVYCVGSGGSGGSRLSCADGTENGSSRDR